MQDQKLDSENSLSRWVINKAAMTKTSGVFIQQTNTAGWMLAALWHPLQLSATCSKHIILGIHKGSETLSRFVSKWLWEQECQSGLLQASLQPLPNCSSDHGLFFFTCALLVSPRNPQRGRTLSRFSFLDSDYCSTGGSRKKAGQGFSVKLLCSLCPNCSDFTCSKMIDLFSSSESSKVPNSE